jgi:biotin-(acetyl-CoA carboxylase) ligase
MSDLDLSHEPLHFPPLMSGEEVGPDVLQEAQMRALKGVEAGRVCYHLGADSFAAAMIFAPDVALEEAMAMLPLCAVGFQNALGALAPPEVAVHLGWDGTLRVNGARCGRFEVAAATQAPEAVPDWLVVGVSVPLWPATDRPGDTPDETALYAEGCADVSAPALVEAWARHTMAWIARWEDEGLAPVHAEWRGLAHGIGEDITRGAWSGTFLGVDERFGMLLRDGRTTHLIPLTALLEAP